LIVGIVPGPDGAVNDAEVAQTVQRFGLTYPQVRDRELDWSRAFHVAGTPTLVALRPDGAEGWRGIRPPADWGTLHKQLRQ